MGTGEVCVNYGDGSQLKLASSASSGGTVTYVDASGQETRYADLDRQKFWIRNDTIILITFLHNSKSVYVQLCLPVENHFSAKLTFSP